MHPTDSHLERTAATSRPQAGRAIRLPLLLAALLAFLAVSTAVAQNTTIVSTERGEVPSTGVRRAGPVLAPAPVARRSGAQPVAIEIEKAEVAAEIETIEIVDGVMQNPTGPWVVSWYKETARLGETGNAVLAGHVDYWDVGPAVFYNLGRLEEGDRINLTGEDGVVYTYEVEWTELYDNADAPLDEIVGPTEDESLTLITCGGEFDARSGEYLSRFVVRATRVEDAGGEDAEG